MTGETHDALIGGGGLAGLALAVALKAGLGSEASIVVADPALARPVAEEGRASAFAACARRLFETLGVWPAMAAEAEPIRAMICTDSRTGDPVRPTFLTFDGDVAPGEPFAHMIPNAVVLNALRAEAERLGVVFVSAVLAAFETRPGALTAKYADGGSITTRLLVGCDGARSPLREAAGISTVGWSYGQSGVVCTVGHERPHDGVAEEHFLPAGPFAILPLTGNRSSIVWTEETHRAKRLCALPPLLFYDELERRFGLTRGEIRVLDQPRAYPLGLSIARRFVADRFALVGDAAHVIHPIAGQGINMGLRDVAALAECVIDAARLGLDPAADDVLDRYERWRRLDTVAMAAATEGLNRLFSNDFGPLRALRDFGLGVVDRMPGLKAALIGQAAGLEAAAPRLMRGEAL